MNKGQVISVGISDLNTVIAPHTIRTSGLGSCVGAVIYDEASKIAGLAHIMLPDSKATRQTVINEYKYADTAIPLLIDMLAGLGARKFALKAKLAGGAQMFQFQSNSDTMRIGPRNILAVEEQLRFFKIPIVAKDVGGNSGRTVEFDPNSSMFRIRTVNKDEKYI